MSTISRRKLITTTTLSVAAARLSAQQDPAARVTLEIPAQATGPHMPADFVGLSYEVQQLTDPSFFAPDNRGLIREFRALTSQGVLRLGGNTSEFAWWKPTSDAKEPEHPHTREVEGEPKALYYPVTADAVRNLAGFLKATGWSCLYGIGMGTNTPERAADEAVFVAKTLGDRLQYFQIGNEADLFSRHLRDPKTWSAKTYLQEWLTMARAVKEHVPGAKFGIPDVAADITWLPQIADEWPSIKNSPVVTTLTHHYYFGGPATNPEVNLPNLLSAATMAKVQKSADIATAAARRMGARVRMTEGNTCYRGGKPGVSDVFGAALWAADYALLLASNNYSGVNLHGGTGKSVANSVGGFLPGDALLKDQGATAEQIQTHPHPFYTPVATFGSEYKLEPVAYGLKFAGLLSGGSFLPADFTSKLQSAGVNATAYAARLHTGQSAFIVLNKEPSRKVALNLVFKDNKTDSVATHRLHAPSLESREAHIDQSPNRERLQDGKYALTVPPASGVCLTVG